MKLNVLKVSFFCITTYLYDELFLENWWRKIWISREQVILDWS